MAFVLAGASGNYLDLLDNLETFCNSNGWTTLATSQEAVSATVAAGGSGYSVSDQLTLDDQYSSQFAGDAVFNVDSIGGGGAVTAVSLVTAGGYHYEPEPNPVTLTGGGGTGCTLNVTWAKTDSTKSGKRLILRGSGAGSDEIFIGVAADDLGGGIVGWTLRGFTGFQDHVDFFSQPGLFNGVAYVPLNDGATTHWFFVNPSRMIMVARMASSYMNMYMGFINRLGTAVDYPYPLMIEGCSTIAAIFSDNIAGFSGMNDPNYHTTSGGVGSESGPAVLRKPDGSWLKIANAAGAFSFRSQRNYAVITPPGRVTLSASASTWDDFIPLTNTSPTFTYRQTPDSTASSNFRFPLIPCLVMENTPQQAIHGELDNVYWAGTLTEIAGQATAEDIYNVNGDDYILFPNCNRTDHWAHFLVKKE